MLISQNQDELECPQQSHLLCELFPHFLYKNHSVLGEQLDRHFRPSVLYVLQAISRNDSD